MSALYSKSVLVVENQRQELKPFVHSLQDHTGSSCIFKLNLKEGLPDDSDGGS